LNLPTKIGNIFTEAFNYTDANRLRIILSQFCRPDCVVRLKLYSLQKPRKKRNFKDDFGNNLISTMDVNTFIEYSRSFYEMVPDVIYSAGDHRSCYEKESSVYISSFTSGGTIIVKDSQIAEHDPAGNVMEIKKHDPQQFAQSSTEGFANVYSSRGSLVSYWDSNAMIYCIELYYEYISGL
jgi:hypothetical protein